MPAVGIEKTDFLLDIRNTVGNFQAKPGYQFAAVRTEEPDAPAAISSGSYTSTEGSTHYQQDFSSTTTKMFVRFGVMHNNSSGSNYGEGEVKLTTATRGCGEILGANTVVINPGLTTGSSSYFPLTGWYPTVDLDKAMAAFVLMDVVVASSLDYRLAFRTADDQSEPNSWVEIETGWTTAATGNATRNSGEVGYGTPSPALNAVMWIQFGLAVEPQTTTCQGTIHTAVAVVHA